MECQRCGKEYDEKIYYLCPQCFCKPTKKERILERIWEFIFQTSTLALLVLAYFGLGYLLGDDAAIVLSMPLLLIWGLSLIKRKEKEKGRLDTKIRKILDDPEFDCVNGFKQYEIIKAIKEEDQNYKGIFR